MSLTWKDLSDGCACPSEAWNETDSLGLGVNYLQLIRTLLKCQSLSFLVCEMDKKNPWSFLPSWVPKDQNERMEVKSCVKVKGYRCRRGVFICVSHGPGLRSHVKSERHCHFLNSHHHSAYSLGAALTGLFSRANLPAAEGDPAPWSLTAVLLPVGSEFSRATWGPKTEIPWQVHADTSGLGEK